MPAERYFFEGELIEVDSRPSDAIAVASVMPRRSAARPDWPALWQADQALKPAVEPKLFALLLEDDFVLKDAAAKLPAPLVLFPEEPNETPDQDLLDDMDPFHEFIRLQNDADLNGLQSLNHTLADFDVAADASANMNAILGGTDLIFVGNVYHDEIVHLQGSLVIIPDPITILPLTLGGLILALRRRKRR